MVRPPHRSAGLRPALAKHVDDRGMSLPRLRPGDAAGAVADLGVLVPLAAALVLVNGLDPSAVLLGAGLLTLASGLVFRVPFPVQPLKALTAVAVAERLAPEIIHAAGLEIGAILLLLSVGRVADGIARVFTKPVVRALQFGVGVLLIVTAWRLVMDPPKVFHGTMPLPWPFLLTVTALAIVVWSAKTSRFGAALGVVAAGTAVAWFLVRPQFAGPSLNLPTLGFPPLSAFASAFFLLVIPQIPLTFGNAVVAVSDLAHEYFGAAARRVSPWRVCLSCGIGNIAAAVAGGMPMCHGAGGLTAHVRLGARTPAMNVLLGSVLAVLGLFYAPQVTLIFGLLPVWALGAFLAYAGLRHALLVRDLRGVALAIAVASGLAGVALGNLAITAAAALAFEHGRRVAMQSRGRKTLVAR
jgi:sulfate permease, SulP family